jgi:hypothetical protein
LAERPAPAPAPRAALGLHRRVAVGLALLAAACGGAAVTTSDAPAGASTTTAPAPTTRAPATTAVDRPAFQGVYEFAGDNSAADATDPALAGVVLVYYWSQIEPAKGVYAWNVIDHDMAPWVAAGKKVVLRVSTSGAPSWDPPYSASGTPAWVYADGTRRIHDHGETLPVYWDPAYLADYGTFVQHLGQRYDGDASVAFVEPGIGMGGETLAETQASAAGIAAWKAAGYSDSVWLHTVETIASFYRASFPTTPVYPLVDRTFFDGSGHYFNTVMSWLAAVPHWGLQDDGLSATQALGPQWAGKPLALEQLNATRVSHDRLCADIRHGLNALHGTYLLIYRSDLVAPGNAACLQRTRAKAAAG